MFVEVFNKREAVEESYLEKPGVGEGTPLVGGAVVDVAAAPSKEDVAIAEARACCSDSRGSSSLRPLTGCVTFVVGVVAEELCISWGGSSGKTKLWSECLGLEWYLGCVHTGRVATSIGFTKVKAFLKSFTLSCQLRSFYLEISRFGC